MSTLVIIVGIILMMLGVRKENKTLRNIGIFIAIIGSIISVTFPNFLSLK
ncbi:hypothetical protein SAMN04487886_11442 [Clostridium sp. DSM 8431]|nr:hypothetical protein [Clostridium sp. DSM 8431]SFU76566.1 hypothetical protein SAMN04487886_11442 [Clostridium sp. DSM 8431]